MLATIARTVYLLSSFTLVLLECMLALPSSSVVGVGCLFAGSL